MEMLQHYSNNHLLYITGDLNSFTFPFPAHSPVHIPNDYARLTLKCRGQVKVELWAIASIFGYIPIKER